MWEKLFHIIKLCKAFAILIFKVLGTKGWIVYNSGIETMIIIRINLTMSTAAADFVVAKA